MTTLSQAYGSTSDSNAVTITLASLTSSATLVAGRQSTVLSNVSTLHVDRLISGQITTGTSPTSGTRIELWAFAPLKFASSSFNYPFHTTTEMGESDAAVTFELAQKKAALAGPLHVITVNSTSDRKYAIPPISIAPFFGGEHPIKVGFLVTHNTGVALNATAGNHYLHWVGINKTSA